MEKLDLEMFRALKSDIIHLSEKASKLQSSLDEKNKSTSNYDVNSKMTFEDLYEEFREIILILSKSNLEDIDYDEWAGMDLSVDRFFPLDFSKTNAKLDFSLIHYNSDPKVTNFSNCKIKNFDFYKTKYCEEMFDENFVNENSKYFLNIDKIPKKIRKRFYTKDLSPEEINQNKKLVKLLEGKLVEVGFKVKSSDENEVECSPIYHSLKKDELKYFVQQYGKYISHISEKTAKKIYRNKFEEKDEIIQNAIEENILNGKIKYDDKAPYFFKRKYPKLFISDEAPDELKLCFYTGYRSMTPEFLNEKSINHKIDSNVLRLHSDWIQKFLEDKEIKNAFSEKYQKLFSIFDINLIRKFFREDHETVIEMVEHNKEELLDMWYKSEGGRSIPNHVVMLNTPEDEIDKFLVNENKWLKLKKIKGYNQDNDSKVAIFKAAYTLGVFEGNESGVSKVKKLFEGLPKKLTEDEYNVVLKDLESNLGDNVIDTKQIEKIDIFKNSYLFDQDYKLNLDVKKDKQKANELRQILEDADLPCVLTPKKLYNLFDKFTDNYNDRLSEFLYGKINEGDER